MLRARGGSQKHFEKSEDVSQEKEAGGRRGGDWRVARYHCTSELRVEYIFPAVM